MVFTNKSTSQAMALDMRRAPNSYFAPETMGDNDTVASSQMSESVVTEFTERDEHSSAEDDKLIRKLTKSSIGDDHSRRRSRGSKRRSRRKRGESLERQISQLILGTASSGVVDTYFDVGSPLKPAEEETTSVEFILQDLVHPNTVELVSGKKATGVSSRGSGTENYITTIQNKLRDSRTQKQLASGPPANMGKEDNFFMFNPDFMASPLNEPAILPSQNLFPLVETQEYDDPSLEINFPEENDGDSTQPDNEVNQPDDELGIISALSSSEFKDGFKSEKNIGRVQSFDSWSWREPREFSKSFGVDPSTSVAISTPSCSSQESREPRTKAEAESQGSRDHHQEHILARESQHTPVASNKESESKVQPQTKSIQQQAVIFKTNFDEWSPFVTMESPFDNIRFSDTLVDPDEFERVGSVDEDGFLKTPPKQRTVKPIKSKIAQSTSRGANEAHSDSNMTSALSRIHDQRSMDSESFGWLHPHSPDSVFDYPSASFHTNGRKADPPGARNLYFPDDVNLSLGTRISI